MEQRDRPLPGLALLAALVQVIGTVRAARGQPVDLDWFGYALLIISGLALTGRRRQPVPSTLVVAAATVTYQVLPYPSGPTLIAAAIAALSGMKNGRHDVVWPVAILSFVTWAILDQIGFGRAAVLFAWGIGGGLVAEFVVFAAGEIQRMAREQRRLFEEKQRRQASEERLRIAQELHDVLGHHLSLINVRAGVGLHLLDRQPDEARAALATIREASAEALREVQSVITALFPDGQSAPLAPAPGLDRLDELTADAGLTVHTSTVGEPFPVPAEVGRAAYRIVQEALTNVRRHAGAGTTVTVQLTFEEERLTVEISDDGGTVGTVLEPTADGNGITGMRERAIAVGGSVLAGPRPEGGWRVRAVLPAPRPETEAPA